MDAAAFHVLEERIYADAQAAARSPAQMPAGRLQPHHYQDAAGRTITEYTGDIGTAFAPFLSGGQVARINRSH